LILPIFLLIHGSAHSPFCAISLPPLIHPPELTTTVGIESLESCGLDPLTDSHNCLEVNHNNENKTLNETWFNAAFTTANDGEDGFIWRMNSGLKQEVRDVRSLIE
jgi:hypothetical protein